MARTGPRQKREADDAVALPELVVHRGGDDDGEADGQIEAAALRAQAGLVAPGQNALIADHFKQKLLHNILRFETAKRTQAFVKDLMTSHVMDEWDLPSPRNRREGAEERATRVAEGAQRRHEALADLDLDELKTLVEAQRKSFKEGGRR